MPPRDPSADAEPPESKSGTLPRRERRRRPRISLSLEVAAPVFLVSDGFRVRGVARNISEGGVLVEVPEAPPPIGTRVEVNFEPIDGSRQASEGLALIGEVRHQLAWSFIQRGEVRGLRGVGIRFLKARASREAANSWIFRAGHTVH